MDGIIDQVRRMPLAEKRELAEALREAIAEELASGAGEPDRCPRCGCPAFARKGRDAACSVATDGRRSYAGSLGGRPHEVRPSRELEMVNSLHSRLKAFVGRFNGVSNRRLQRYLDWSCWREQFRRSARGRRELLFAHEASGIYVCTRELTHLESHPFLSLANRVSIGERYGYMLMVV